MISNVSQKVDTLRFQCHFCLLLRAGLAAERESVNEESYTTVTL